MPLVPQQIAANEHKDRPATGGVAEARWQHSGGVAAARRPSEASIDGVQETEHKMRRRHGPETIACDLEEWEEQWDDRIGGRMLGGGQDERRGYELREIREVGADADGLVGERNYWLQPAGQTRRDERSDAMRRCSESGTCDADQTTEKIMVMWPSQRGAQPTGLYGF
ncbi:hypothetical protein GUJ93_ZPchr0003g18663 [Zizania palustris]|uniref:Uncharacterized protein n=1 Tax=Zizania palustris TaxID=103762 RepID=A0A8J5SDR2_ZIZPA|nr:hypothetical protein GUJ93_ZPchr0003g18663 [Zizania palustris]